jgi:hypothetical protein
MGKKSIACTDQAKADRRLNLDARVPVTSAKVTKLVPSVKTSSAKTSKNKRELITA